jgi:hypothetical protein
MCDSCVGQICQSDPYCCQTAWDGICVDEVESICGKKCSGSPDCDSQYQKGTLGYALCSEVKYECAFAFDSTAQSCAQICSSHGGECFGAFDDQNDKKCKYGNQATCQSKGLSSAICVCSRGCGSNPPCPANLTCVGGKCK